MFERNKSEVFLPVVESSHKRFRSKAISMSPNSSRNLLEFIYTNEESQDSVDLLTFFRAKRLCDVLDVSSPKSMVEELKSNLRDVLKEIATTRADVFSNLFAVKKIKTSHELAIFQSNIWFALHLSRCLDSDSSISPIQLRESLQRELLYAKLLPFLKEVRCKICLTSVYKWALDEHSENCFKFNFLKNNLDKLNQLILPLCDRVKQSIFESNFKLGTVCKASDSNEPKISRSQESQKYSAYNQDNSIGDNSKIPLSIFSALKDRSAEPLKSRSKIFQNPFISKRSKLSGEGRSDRGMAESQISFFEVQNISDMRAECSIANTSMRQSSVTGNSGKDLNIPGEPLGLKNKTSVVLNSSKNEIENGYSFNGEKPGFAPQISYQPFRSEQVLFSNINGLLSTNRIDFGQKSEEFSETAQNLKRVNSPEKLEPSEIGQEKFINRTPVKSIDNLASFPANLQVFHINEKFKDLREMRAGKEDTPLPAEFSVNKLTDWQGPSEKKFEDIKKAFSTLRAVTEQSDQDSIHLKGSMASNSNFDDKLKIIEINDDFELKEKDLARGKSTASKLYFTKGEQSSSSFMEITPQINPRRVESSNFNFSNTELSASKPPLNEVAENFSPLQINKSSTSNNLNHQHSASDEKPFGDAFSSRSNSIHSNVHFPESGMKLEKFPEQNFMQVKNDIVRTNSNNFGDTSIVQKMTEDSKPRTMKNSQKNQMIEMLRRTSNTDYVQVNSFQNKSKDMLLFTLGREVGKYKQNLLVNPYFDNFFNDQELVEKLSQNLINELNSSETLQQLTKELVKCVSKRVKIIQRSKKYFNNLKKITTKSKGNRILRELKSRSFANLNDFDDKISRVNVTSSIVNSEAFDIKKSNELSRRESAGLTVIDPVHPYRRTNSDSQIVNINIKEKIYEMKTSTVNVEDFIVEKLLGKGGFGSVYLVRQKVTNDYFAMKSIKFPTKLNVKFIEDLQNEISILKLIKGKFLAKAYFSFIENDCLFIVMEYLVGGDFRQLLETEGYFEFNITQFYAAELVMALEELHKKIVHRDLKPENLLLDNNGHLKLADFGLSELHTKYSNLVESEGGHRFIRPSKKGTLDYIPPEVLFPEQDFVSIEEIPIMPKIQKTEDKKINIKDFIQLTSSPNLPTMKNQPSIDCTKEEQPIDKQNKFKKGTFNLGSLSISQEGESAEDLNNIKTLDRENVLREMELQSSNIFDIDLSTLAIQDRNLDNFAQEKAQQINYTRSECRPYVSQQMLADCSKVVADLKINEIAKAQKQLEVIDWWAVGCLIYEFSTGVSPFGAETLEEIENNIRNHRIEWIPIGTGPDQMTQETKDIIEKFLERNPKKRLGANGTEEIKSHPFFKGIEWNALKSQKAPFVPDDKKKYPIHGGGKISMAQADSGFKSEFGDLKMNRIDLLDENNQKLFHTWKGRYDKIMSKLLKLSLI